MEPIQEEYFYYDKAAIIGRQAILTFGILITVLFFYRVGLFAPWYWYAIGIAFDGYVLYTMWAYYIKRFKPAANKQWVLKMDLSGITNPLIFGNIPWSLITKIEYRHTSNPKGLSHSYVDIHITDAKAYYTYNNDNPIDGEARYKKLSENCIRLCTDLFKVENKEDVFDSIAAQLEHYTGITSVR